LTFPARCQAEQSNHPFDFKFWTNACEHTIRLQRSGNIARALPSSTTASG